MIGALSARPKPVRIALAGLSAAGACALLASSAAAAAPARLVTTHAVRLDRPASRSLKTLFATVRVFRSATHGGVAGKLIRRGTVVSVTCWTTGSYYRDVPIWYAISAPAAGYVSAFNLAAHFAPAIGIPHCLAPAFKEQFDGLEAHLRIRSGPSVTATVAGYLGGVGSKVTVDCYVAGTPIFKDPVWYHAVSPRGGYVSGRMLNTGGDPAPGVPHC